MDLVRKAEVKPPSNTNPRVSKELDSVVARGLEKLPEQRFQSAEQMAQPLREILAGYNFNRSELKDLVAELCPDDWARQQSIEQLVNETEASPEVQDDVDNSYGELFVEVSYDDVAGDPSKAQRSQPWWIYALLALAVALLILAGGAGLRPLSALEAAALARGDEVVNCGWPLTAGPTDGLQVADGAVSVYNRGTDSLHRLERDFVDKRTRLPGIPDQPTGSQVAESLTWDDLLGCLDSKPEADRHVDDRLLQALVQLEVFNDAQAALDVLGGDDGMSDPLGRWLYHHAVVLDPAPERFDRWAAAHKIARSRR